MHRIHLAMAAWEIGRVKSGLGAQTGGLGAVMQELPAQLIAYAARQGLELEIELLCPCFAHYDKRRMTAVPYKLPVTLEGRQFEVSAYSHIFDDGVKAVYFWDDWQLNWTGPGNIYPEDTRMARRLYAVVSQAMAAYIRKEQFNTIHLHDYHLALIPFYLGDAFLQNVPPHFTIHNASYQGVSWFDKGGYQALWDLGLPGERLFHKYFDFNNLINLMKGAMIKTHEMGGKITTVSGDLQAAWGYAAELKESEADLWRRAMAQKRYGPVYNVFPPNRHLDIFEQLPIVGITNGMSDANRPESLPELKAKVLSGLQAKTGRPLFQNPLVQSAMLSRDHTFSSEDPAAKSALKSLLHLEAFGDPDARDTILMAVVGRLVAQKNLGMVAEIVARTIAFDPGVKFVILASANDPEGYRTEERFFSLAQQFPAHVYFNNTFNQPLAKLILSGSDFSLIPSRFEPCGLVDYEASLLGSVVIGRRVGGLAKVDPVAYLYDWLDVGDVAGEAQALLSRIEAAVTLYRKEPSKHRALMKKAMQIDTSWEPAVRDYLRMYRYGFLVRRWWKEKSRAAPSAQRFLDGLDSEETRIFSDFFSPVWGDSWDWKLDAILVR